jgi:hypothetical protein
MVAKDEQGNSVQVPGLQLTNDEEIRRFCNCIKQISLKKERDEHEEVFDYKSATSLARLKTYRVQVIAPLI